ncbi:MAG TPA: TIR domain-containing protein [Pyrinomonadaceae bacterium]|nr:TIR domain-containing protein [Pyrinomonadaceae bacterium]
MVEHFRFDVFLSHSANDKLVVRPIAERLRDAGLNVWFDEWVLEPGDDVSAKIEEGLERSRALVLCVSKNAVGSERAQLESQTLRFRDPLNSERRFVVVRLDDTELKDSLGQVQYIDLRSPDNVEAYARLREICLPRTDVSSTTIEEKEADKVIQLAESSVNCYAFSPDGKCVLSGTERGLTLWELEPGQPGRVLSTQAEDIWRLVWGHSEHRALSGSWTAALQLWDTTTERCLRTVQTGNQLWGIALDRRNEQCLVANVSELSLWDLKEGRRLAVFQGSEGGFRSIAWSENEAIAVSGHGEGAINVWDVAERRHLRRLDGHTKQIWAVALSADGLLAVSGSWDNTVRLWETATGKCLRVLEGHTSQVDSIACTRDGRFALSGSLDATVRLWHLETGQCLCVLTGHQGSIKTVRWSADERQAFSGDTAGGVRIWDLSKWVSKSRPYEDIEPRAVASSDQVQYTNAKVLLVGESGAGKTGLSKVLAGEQWQPSDSTVGAWATQWKLPVTSDKSVEKEIWLWDFGGQADQRLIHQLYMDETSLAVLVFDGQKEDLFDTLGQWDRDLTRASRKDFAKLLVAGRIDAGGLRVSRVEVEKFAKDHKFKKFLETSAKKNLGCDDLKVAILTGINWDDIPCRTTEVVFKKLKEEIIRLKDEGRVLMRFNELRDSLQLRLAAEYNRFADQELHAVLTLLAGPGVVWELAFGSWVLLQPERINAYAQAVIGTLRADEHQRGCVMEERVLKGDLSYESSMARLAGDDERFVLLAMHQTLVERGLCLRQPTDKGNLLVFPSYYRRERPEQVKFPAVLVNYRFSGFLDDIYSTLVVRLHHSDAFEQDQLWRYAADFKTNTGKQLGVKLNRRAPGVGELEVYFDPSVAIEEKIIFSKYVHEHLLQHARDVERLRHYVCQNCRTPVGNRELAMQRLNDWLQGRPVQADGTKLFKIGKRKKELPSIICANCEQRVQLWDEMEQWFANPEIQQRVREMQTESEIELSNQSKERALVGDVISTVALANQISREFNVSDHGIDMEIEFTDDNDEATGLKVYLQLKSGDSYLHKRKKDGTEVFTIKDERHVRYWMNQIAPVLLVIRNSEGEVRWMEVREWLRRESDNGQKPVKQIIFEGERFDVMSVRRWRDRVLAG